VPLRPIVVAPPVVELLLRVRVPDSDPASAGSNCTVSVAVWLGFSVSGKLAPETEYSAPVTVAELIVTAAVPVELRITVWVDGVFTPTLPNARLFVLTPSVGLEDPNCSAKLVDWLPALAISVTVVAFVTAVTVAVKLPLLAPPASARLSGTDTAVLLLARSTRNPLLGAAAFSVTVQLSCPAPAIELLLQVNPVNAGTPVPLSATGTTVPPDESLVNARVPVAAPATVGTNCTVSVAF
jgi:hypothetical protein